jgi:NADPH:quinone reductase-like Zn-dependent oxidoreductase
MRKATVLSRPRERPKRDVAQRSEAREGKRCCVSRIVLAALDIRFDILGRDEPLGDIVSGLTGWQNYVAMNSKGQLNKLPPGAPLELAMSALGLTGVTAYCGLLEVGRPVAGETVVVYGAAGATGSVTGQIAKIKGRHAIGMAGGAETAQAPIHLFEASLKRRLGHPAAFLAAVIEA